MTPVSLRSTSPTHQQWETTPRQAFQGDGRSLVKRVTALLSPEATGASAAVAAASIGVSPCSV